MEFYQDLLLLLLLQEKMNIFFLPAGNYVISGWNHKDAVTRLVLHDSKVDSDVAVVCKDTDVLILMIWAYSKLNKTNNWYFKNDNEKFAVISKICCYLGKTFSLNLPKIKALTDAALHLIFTESGKLKHSKNFLVNKIYVFYSQS